MKRKRRSMVVFMLLFALGFSLCRPECVRADKEPVAHFERSEAEVSITAKSAILIEINSGRVLYEKNADEMLRPASVTKVMTLLLIFEALAAGDITYDDVVTVSEHAASMGGSQCFFEAGEQQTVRDMIKCIEVASGNDAAVAMAEFLAGSEEAFVNRMNERAAELHMEHTHFDNACGLEVATHLTSARDISIMSRQLLKYHPEILEFSTIWMDSITHTTRRGQSRFDLANTNKFLNLYAGANGLKTGYTSQAKYCMSASAERNGISLIAVIMGAETKEARNSEAMKLLDYGFAHCKTYEDSNVLGEICAAPVKNGTRAEVSLKPIESYTLTLVDMEEGLLEKKVEFYRDLQAPIHEGDAVGVVQYSYQGELLDEIIVYAGENVGRNNMKNSISKVMTRLFMVK